MKQLFTLLSFILCLQLSAQDFEGSIVMELNTPETEQDLEMTFYVKGESFAMVMSDPSGQESTEMRMIIDKPNNEMLMIIEGEDAMVMKYDLDVMKELQEGKKGGLAPDGDTENAEIKLEDIGKFTGKTKTIDGFLCKEFISKEDGKTIQMWITEEIDIDFEDIFPQTPGTKTDNPFSRTNGPDGFPMELTATDEATGEVMSMKSRVKREKIDNAVFTVPEGVEIMDMTFMMQMMQGGEK